VETRTLRIPARESALRSNPLILETFKIPILEFSKFLHPVRRRFGVPLEDLGSGRGHFKRYRRCRVGVHDEIVYFGLFSDPKIYFTAKVQHAPFVMVIVIKNTILARISPINS
jgi:hypothetical protein